MKSCTDIPQSEKLAEILPIKSADMMYKQILPKSGRISHVPEIGNPSESLEWYNKGYTYAGKKALSIEEYCIPCWSLAALLNTLPISCDDGHHCLTLINANPHGEIEWIGCYEDSKGDWLHECYANNQVDACFELILKLKENQLI